MDKTLYCYLTIVTKVTNEERISCIELTKEDRDELLANEQIELQYRKERQVTIFEYYKLIINK